MPSGPDAGLLPGLKSAPAGHAATAAHLDGEVFPRDAGLEDEKDAGEGLAVADGFAAGAAEATGLVAGQQRAEDFPKFIGDKRLGHDNTSGGVADRPTGYRRELHANSLILLVALKK